MRQMRLRQRRPLLGLRAIDNGEVRHEHGGKLRVRRLALHRVEQRVRVPRGGCATWGGRWRCARDGGEGGLLLEQCEALLLLSPRLQLHLELLLLLGR